MKNLLHIILAVMLLSSCVKENHVAPKSQLVVDGWIEDGRFPIVQVSLSAPVTEEVGEMSDFMVKYASVSISDGEKTVMLTGRYDNAYYPPYIYSTTDMRGKEGRTYTLKVCYKEMELSAETSILAKPVVDEIYTELVSEGRYRICAKLQDDPTKNDWYLPMVAMGEGALQYVTAFMGVTADYNLVDGVLHVFRPLLVYNDANTTLYKAGETVNVKIASVDETAYTFWKDYEEVRSLSRIPLFPAEFNIRTNIVGGLGHWTGINAVEKTLSIPE